MPIWDSFTYKDLTKVLKHFGCYLAEQGRGSHETRYNPRTEKVFTIFFHAGRTFKIKTLFSIFEDAGIDRKEVLGYLKGKKSD